MKRTPRFPASRGPLLLFILLACGRAEADQALATAKSCMACHAVGARLLGPALRDVSGRYRDRPDATPLLAESIRKGSSGAWGSVPMPPQAQVVSAKEAEQLAAWILKLP